MGKLAGIRAALSELVVIVLGVLIALLAESAWNDYLDRKAGLEYIARLSSELKKNLEYLDDDVLWANQACSSSELALSELRATDSEPNPAEMLRLVISAATYPAPDYQRATYDDLIGTGNLSLIDDAGVRERAVAVYTEFFEQIAAWRPPKDTGIRKAAVQTLPAEFILRVIEECIVEDGGHRFAATVRPCRTIPSSETPHYWYSKLEAHSDIERALSERAWQVCDFERTVGDVKANIRALIPILDEMIP